MTKREEIKKELKELYEEGTKLAVAFQKKEDKQFQYDYQRWYTKALKAVESLAPDRLQSFAVTTRSTLSEKHLAMAHM